MLLAFTILDSALSYVPGSLIMKMSAFFPYKAAGQGYEDTTIVATAYHVLVTSWARTSAFQIHGLDFNHSDRDFGNPVRHAKDYIRGGFSPSFNSPLFFDQRVLPLKKAFLFYFDLFLK